MDVREVFGGSLADIFSRLYVPAVLILGICVLLILRHCIYNLYFHPLRKFPGPILWRASHLPRYIAELRGVVDLRIRDFHDKYGEVVRISPDQLTFGASAAWKDIHGYAEHHLPRDPSLRAFIIANVNEPGLLQADNANHSRMRRSLAHAFSEKALREQEPIIQKYVDELISQLKDVARMGDKVDMTSMYMRTTVDITTELSFGTSFNTLKDERFRAWMSMQARVGVTLTLVRLVLRYPIAGPIVKVMASREVMKFMDINRKHVNQVVSERLAQGVMEEKKDFTSYMLKNRDQGKGMTDGELLETARSLILAGAETTRTVLAGATYFLLLNPGVLKKVTAEVRTAFEKEEDITFVSATAKLPYMLAVLDETMRIRPAVVTVMVSRITPSGPPTSIAGYSVPENTLVSAHPLAMNFSESNFYKPYSFIPERWMSVDSSAPYANDDRAAFQPFFIGPRNCIGRNLAYSKMRVILARMLWNFDLELCEESRDWKDQLVWFGWDQKPLMCRLKMREGINST